MVSSPQLASREQVAEAIVSSGRGILAADESTGTLKKRFDTIGLEASDENGARYREMLFRTSGAEESISGVILFDTTIRQTAADGRALIRLLEQRGMIPGIKVDKGLAPLALAPGELVTEGLDGLGPRLEKYRAVGARFGKWRAVIGISTDAPSDYCINVNAHSLARYAALCISHDLVPIVEPEVLMEGDHTIDSCQEATERALSAVYEALEQHRVPLAQTLLKVNMVLSGSSAIVRAAPEEVAEKTLTCFKKCVPATVPGILFLSGGQSEREATANLNALNVAEPNPPWALSFSFGRALQESALKAWGGKDENIVRAQQTYLHRARLNAAAVRGEYTASLEAGN